MVKKQDISQFSTEELEGEYQVRLATYKGDTPGLLKRVAQTVCSRDERDVDSMEALYGLAQHLDRLSEASNFAEIIGRTNAMLGEYSLPGRSTRGQNRSNGDFGEFVKRMQRSKTKDPDRILNRMGVPEKTRRGYIGAWNRFYKERR